MGRQDRQAAEAVRRMARQEGITGRRTDWKGIAGEVDRQWQQVGGNRA